MVNYINETGTIGVIYQAININITGSDFLTMLGVTLFIMFCFFLFRIPVEASVILIMPILFIFMAFSSNFLAIVGVMIIYMVILLVKNWFF